MWPICYGKINIVIFKLALLLLMLVKILSLKYNTAKQKLFCTFNIHNRFLARI